MAQTRKVDTARFNAVGENGNRYVIIESVTQVLSAPLSGRSQWLDGSRSYRLSTGGPVNWVEEGVFEIVMSGDIAKVAGA